MEQDGKSRDKPTHLIFDKRGKNIQWRKESLFNKWCWENWTATCKRMNLEHFLTPYTKINSNLAERPKCKAIHYTILRGNIGRTLSETNHCKILFDPPPREMEIKTEINNLDLMKLKTFAQQRKP